MAGDDAQLFWAEVRRSEALQAELRALPPGDRDAVVAAIAAVAERAGFAVTPETIAASLPRQGELDDAALDGVAGGTSFAVLLSSPEVESPSSDATVAGFSEVSGLSTEITASEYRSGTPWPGRRS